jgi:hypothetical protein
VTGITIQWATQKDISKTFNIGRDKLNELVLDGYIRSTPLSNTEKSKRLYCCEDLDHYLKARSAGRQPRIMRGKK